jgi:hypothetical protein
MLCCAVLCYAAVHLELTLVPTVLLLQVAMSLLWHTTISVGGHEYSLVFCLLFFLVGACSATSNVTHFTYVSVFPSNETTAVSTGMALGSMLAGLLGMLQGSVLGAAGMSIAANYLAVAALYLPALYLVWSRAPLILHHPAHPEEDETEFPALLQSHEREQSQQEEEEQSQQEEEQQKQEHYHQQQQQQQVVLGGDLVHSRYKSLLALQLANCAMGYGVVPSLVSPVCSRFASPSSVLLLATGLYCLLDPLCRACTAVRPIRTLQGIREVSALMHLLAAALLATLLLPESSGLLTSKAGGAYAILVYVGEG